MNYHPLILEIVIITWYFHISQSWKNAPEFLSTLRYLSVTIYWMVLFWIALIYLSTFNWTFCSVKEVESIRQSQFLIGVVSQMNCGIPPLLIYLLSNVSGQGINCVEILDHPSLFNRFISEGQCFDWGCDSNLRIERPVIITWHCTGTTNRNLKWNITAAHGNIFLMIYKNMKTIVSKCRWM